MRAPCSLRLAIRCSSRSLLATIFADCRPAVVEDLPRLDAEVGEVPGVEADADRLVPPLAQAEGHLGGAPDAVERVVGVHEEDAVVGLRPRPGLEGLELRREGHDPAVGVRAPHRQAEEASREHVRGRGDAAHVGRARGAEAAVGALRPPQAEVDHLVAPRGEADPGGLGRDQRLEVDEVEERRLDELRVEDRPPHADEGLVGEHDRALGDRVDVAAQAQLAQLAQEGRVEERPAVVAEEAAQVGDVLGREVEAGQVVESAGEAAGHREAAAEGVSPEEEVEHGLLLRPARVTVGLGHGQLVQVRREGERGPVDVGEMRHASHHATGRGPEARGYNRACLPSSRC